MQRMEKKNTRKNVLKQKHQKQENFYYCCEFEIASYFIKQFDLFAFANF